MPARKILFSCCVDIGQKLFTLYLAIVFRSLINRVILLIKIFVNLLINALIN